MSIPKRLLPLGLRVLSALCGGAAGLLLLRLFFRLLIANPANPLTPLVYTLSRPLLFPWDRLWPLLELPELAVEKATLAALGMYLVLGLALGLLGQALPRPPGRPTGREEELG